MATKEDNKKRRLQAIAYAQEAKNKPCADCDESYPYYIMDFDHKPDSEKKYLINKLVKTGTAISTLQKEIDKCDVVCSNCHRIRTHKRMTS